MRAFLASLTLHTSLSFQLQRRATTMVNVVDIEDAYKTYALRDAAATTKDLLKWWDRGHRSMPWRRESTEPVSAAERTTWAYRVWVSEVMLQQTQVSRVAPYFERWMAKWPDVHALAAAPEEDVQALWSGLGYYRRCKFLREGAAALAAPGAPWPTTRADWLKVKGVGPYTAAAVSSIVYGEACPVVDGNVVRVVSRLAACGVAPSSTVGAKLWWRLAAQLVPADATRPGDANQAMMELGATVCTKANPACGACPVKATCATHKRGEDPARYPAAEAKAKPVKVAVAALVLQTERLGKTVFALAKPAGKDASAFRSDAGLYELPAVRLGAPDPTPAQLDAALGAALDGARRGGARRDAEVVLARTRAAKAVAHSITSTRYAVTVERLVLRADPDDFDVVWLDAADLATRATSSLVAKALKAALVDAAPAKKRQAPPKAAAPKKAPRVVPIAAEAVPIAASEDFSVAPGSPRPFASFAFAPDDDEVAA